MTDEAAARHRDLIETLGAAVLDGPAVLDPDLRRAAARNDGVPEPFTAFVDRIHRHAYRTTDEHVADLRADGADQDAVFEITVAAAYGAALERLDAGLRAVRELEEER
jgi:hypothetical protein